MGAPKNMKLTRSQSWMSLAAEVSHLPSIKVGSASLRNRFRSSSVSTPSQFFEPALAVASPRPTSQCPRKSALKRPSPTRRASYPCYSITSGDIDESIPSLDETHSANIPEQQGDTSPPGAPALKIAAHALLDRVRQIHIFSPSPRPRRVSRVFPDLLPAPDLDEVSVTIESDDFDDEDSFAPMTRKVRFVVPAPPPPPTPEPEWEEPACFRGAYDHEVSTFNFNLIQVQLTHEDLPLSAAIKKHCLQLNGFFSAMVSMHESPWWNIFIKR
ncbi:hypothetical protein C8R45DRAFT_939853 [Mycena sanguinolenta]|nr:hypothetical protein C8R45DRAFT_939853 [Mycena sanguinolenta]